MTRHDRPFALHALKLLSWISLSGSVAAIGWLSWLIQSGYASERQRCGTVPDQYYPELGWIFLIFPAAAALILSLGAIWMSRKIGRWAWVLQAPAMLVLAGVCWSTWMSVSVCAISYSR